VLSFAGISLSPAVGAILMSASTVAVAFNAQLLRRLDLRPGPHLAASATARAAPARRRRGGPG
jgi:Cu2+-exporting ATPase